MRKFENKYIKRAKEYLSLLKELEYLREFHFEEIFRYRSSNSLKSQYNKIKKRLKTEFYNEYCGWYHTATHFYRNMKNRKLRYKSKKIIKNWMVDTEKEIIFEDNYSDCSWFW